jgi:RNA polymerase sigma factor (sigma-70 family)
MAYLTSGSVVCQIGSLFEGGAVAGLSDRQLLERFTATRDAVGEAAFAALVSRHGPMVLDVCRQILSDLHHAEDVFQAVFLVLARKASSIREPDLLANWLYGVALRTARCKKLEIARRRKKEEGDAMTRPGAGSAAVVESTVEPVEQPAIDREQAEALHDEIDRLPRSFRVPVVLCYFEGLTLDEAARRLRCPAGTVGSRLARARDKLRRGLTRRGVALPTAVLGGALALRSASASILSPLSDITIRAAIKFAAGQTASGATSASVTALAHDVLRSTLIHKLRIFAITVLLLGAVATGAGYLTQSLATARDEPRQASAPKPTTVVSRPDDSRRSAPGRLMVTGRVLDPVGVPLPEADVALVAGMLQQAGDPEDIDRNRVLGSAKVDRNGRFHVDVPRTNPDLMEWLVVIAGARGWGVGGQGLNREGERHEVTITMEPEQAIRGRLFDVQGRAAAGVPLQFAFVQAKDQHFWLSVPSRGVRFLPPPATTDGQGRFILRGLGPRALVDVEVHDDRYARQSFRLGDSDEGKDRDKIITLVPAQVVEVRVLRDDGKPMAGASVAVAAQHHGNRVFPWEGNAVRAQADAQGRVQVVPWAGDYFYISAGPPAGEPLMGSDTYLEWPTAAARRSVEVTLPRGIAVRGTVTEGTSATPVDVAVVRYFQTRRDNPLFSAHGCQAVSGHDGAFEMVLPAGPGHLLVQAPTSDYLHVVTSHKELGTDKLPNTALYPDAVTQLDLKAGAAASEVTLRLRRGVTVEVRAFEPGGEPVEQAIVFGRTFTRSENMSPFNGVAPTLRVRSGRVEVPGCDQETQAPFHIFDVKHQTGATFALSGRSAVDGPVTIRLRECGSATVRYRNDDGKQVAGRRPDDLYLLITPGADFGSTDRIVADMVNQVNLDPDRTTGLKTDAAGRVTFVSLIPGARYRLLGQEFTAEAGKTVELQDITIPRAEGRSP